MYAKLAISNARKSIKDYLIYFITIILCVSLFYAFMSLSSPSYELITEESYNFEMLKIMLKYSTYVITGLLVVLIGYVNKYMMKRRQKEFATYILLKLSTATPPGAFIPANAPKTTLPTPVVSSLKTIRTILLLYLSATIKLFDISNAIPRNALKITPETFTTCWVRSNTLTANISLLYNITPPVLVAVTRAA